MPVRHFAAVSMVMLVASLVPTVGAQSSGKITGTVSDPNGAVIPNVTVILESQQTKQKTLTNEKGVYEIELLTGVYRITTYISVYYPYRRASFCVQPNTVTTINIAPPLRVLSVGSEVTSSGSREPVNLAAPPKYEAFSPPYSSCGPIDLLVRFNKQRKHQSYIEYSKAVTSYNALTIHADRTRLNPKTFHLEAEGNVIIEDGKQTLHANLATLEFKDRKPIFKVIR